MRLYTLHPWAHGSQPVDFSVKHLFLVLYPGFVPRIGLGNVTTNESVRLTMVYEIGWGWHARSVAMTLDDRSMMEHGRDTHDNENGRWMRRRMHRWKSMYGGVGVQGLVSWYSNIGYHYLCTTGWYFTLFHSNERRSHFLKVYKSFLVRTIR